MAVRTGYIHDRMDLIALSAHYQDSYFARLPPHSRPRDLGDAAPEQKPRGA